MTNAYGLTYSRWLAAAHVSPSAAHRTAWRAGEDPSDYRASRSRSTERKKRWTAPKYRPHAFRKAEESARTHRSLAKFYLKEARYWEKAAREDTRPTLRRQWRQKARVLRARAKRILEKGHRYQGVYSRSTEKRPRSSRARRGPVDRAAVLARSVKKWKNSTKRGEALTKWREEMLRDSLERHGLEGHFGRVKHLVHPTLEDRTRASRKSDHERYVRAYGRG